MWNPEGEADRRPLRPCFDRRLKLEFHGSRVTSDAGLLAYRELDDALGLTALAGHVLADSRTGKNGWHGVVGLLRQSVYGRLAGYEDVNDADRLGRDPAMRWIVGGKAVERGGAQGGTGSELAVTIPTFGGCPAPRTTQSDLALAARPGPGMSSFRRTPSTAPGTKVSPITKAGVPRMPSVWARRIVSSR